MIKCPILACLLAFPIAAIIGLVYRFPIPLGGYLSGVDAIVPSMLAVLFYSLFGLLPAIFVLGVGAGALIPKDNSERSMIPNVYEIVASSIAAIIPLGVLSVLDKIIGPW
jgi:hypothetical protein